MNRYNSDYVMDPLTMQLEEGIRIFLNTSILTLNRSRLEGSNMDILLELLSVVISDPERYRQAFLLAIKQTHHCYQFIS